MATSYKRLPPSLESQTQARGLGRPVQRRHVDRLDIFSALVSLVCLVIGVLVVTPKVSWAWRLGFDNQIIVVGFILSIMNICLRRAVPLLMLILEARWGKSILQNYDAILRNQILHSNTSLIWRITLFVFLALPIGLSVAYKQFLGGTSTYRFENTHNWYGMTAPPGLEYFGFNTGLSLMANATQHFVSTTTNRTFFPVRTAKFPLAFGFNNLVLSNTSSAFLDAPMPDFARYLQSQLRDTEYRTVTADVNATVTKLVTIAPEDRSNTSFWDPYFNVTNVAGLQTNKLWTGYDIGLLINNGVNTNTSWCFIGIFPTVKSNPGFFFNQTDPQSLSFKNTSRMFHTHRERCRGTWRISRSSFELVSGQCTGQWTNQDIFSSPTPRFWYSVYIQMLTELLGQFSNTNEDSPWLLPGFANAIAAMYWSRFTADDGYEASKTGPNKAYLANTTTQAQRDDTYYGVRDDIVSTIATLQPSGWLYFVLALQPLILIVVLVWIEMMRSTPITQGFGLVTILAGADTQSLARLEGSTLSGNLARPVPVKIQVERSSVEGSSSDDDITSSPKSYHGVIRYVIDQPNDRTGLIQKNVSYR